MPLWTREQWHTMEPLKGNFHIKNSGKEIWLTTNGLEVGGNISQSPQTRIIFQENTAEEEEGTEDQSLLRAEQMAQQRKGNAIQSSSVSQEENLQGIFKVCLHIYLSQSCDKIRINLLY